MKLLYYPSIAIPDNNWLRKALLYSDGVQSIVPQGYFDYHASPDAAVIRFLEDQGEYSELNPAVGSRHLMDASDLDREFRSAFAPMLRVHKQLSRGRRLGPRVKMHQEKFSFSVLDFCLDMDVAKRADDDWYLFDRDVGELYISILAKFLALRSSEYVVPSTDLGTIANIVWGADSVPTSLCLNYELVNSLPEPDPNVPLIDLIHFKRHRREELLEFRATLSEYESSLRDATDAVEIRAISERHAERIERGVFQLGRLLKERRVEFGVASVKGLISFRQASPLVAAAVSAALKTMYSIPLQAAFTTAGAAAALIIGCEAVSLWTAENTARRNSAFAYLHAAGKSGLLV